MENSKIVKGGDGPNSYFKNSKLQGNASDLAKKLLVDGIAESLELPPKDYRAAGAAVFAIADFGCSVGPNTFSSVASVIEAVKHKYEKNSEAVPEFHVFFNDQVSNDFNTLFRSIPHDKQYTAAGVPGSFHGRLLPKFSINLMISNVALNWLSKIPESVTKRDTPQWNKGRVTYARSSPQVVEAFKARFVDDMRDFFGARSEELIPGGLLAILIPCRSQGTSPCESNVVLVADSMGDALADLVNQGIISEDVVDSFNFPTFIPTASEMEEIIVTNHGKHFSIEAMQEIHLPSHLNNPQGIQHTSNTMRAVMECLLNQHIGLPHVVDEAFRRYPEKIENLVKNKAPDNNTSAAQFEMWEFLFVLLKRNRCIVA
ncbi:OLC1v1005237C1 [Oldenlandia corymbosa var. corymbosa]|uniref:OLC1v1005237C1 n=1 Tax=Oldenlandia corymbosa var. corymbosa TaxID=529605 RepID=A0AAV1DG70_OLDCO|nr:OLC1v1005237C1 [Oldenlandia corymbosa var. corymbosa]